MLQPAAFQVVDLYDSGTALTVQWRSAPGTHARPVDLAMLERIGKHVTALAAAERHAGLAREIVVPSLLAPSGPGLAAAQRALGETVYELLDGPDRALARRVEDARRDGATLHVVVRLRAADRKALARHRALGWHLQLIASAEGPLALAPDVTIAVQIGDAEIMPPETVPGGRLQVLFMAYSPRDVQPVLDYEGEEERILDELAPFVEERRLVLKVAEDGSLDELRRRLMRRAYDVVHLTGHGVVTDRGPRLVMEDATGDRDDVSAEQLLKALRDGRAMPRLLVLSSFVSDGDVDTTTSVKWFEFERDVRALLSGLGFSVQHVAASRRGDRGVDVFARKGEDIDEVCWVIQCKCWSPSRKVGPDVVRELVGALAPYPSGTRGMIVTTSGFTSGAKTEAEARNVRLMDGAEFLRRVKAIES